MIDSTLTFESDSGKVSICYRCLDISICKEDAFPFVALSLIRKELELQKLKLICKGCLINVHPSGAAYPIIKGYQLEIGKPTGRENLVDIFDSTDDVDRIATVQQQELFYKEWLNSQAWYRDREK